MFPFLISTIAESDFWPGIQTGILSFTRLSLLFVFEPTQYGAHFYRTRPLQNRCSGYSGESRTLQFTGEMRRSADRRYDEKEFFRGLNK
jgi:hypothetical protein